MPYCHYSVELKEKLGVRHYYRHSYFVEVAVEETLSNGNMNGKIDERNDDDQFQLCRDAMTWLGYDGDEITELCFKQQHMSMQKCINTHGQKVKDSAVKEMKNLTLKNIFLER